MLKIYLLGSFQLIRDGITISEADWHTKQARQLLKVLLTEGGKIFARDRLIDLLWADANPRKAATTLRTAINALRKTLEPDRPPYTPSTYIVAHAPGYKFQFTEDVWLDIHAFEDLLKQAANSTHFAEKQDLLNQAIALYRDDYLSDDLYADWAYFEREHFRERYLTALNDLAECQANQGDYERAIASLRRILARDPGREPVYRTLMRYYLQIGNTVAALKAFEYLRTYLAEELGCDPSPQTLTLHQAVLNGQITWQAPPSIATVPPKSPLNTVFVGRETELKTLTELLSQIKQSKGSMILLDGEAGVGKTKLATVLLHKAAKQGLITLSGYCHAVEQSLPFAPIIEALETFISHRPNSNLNNLPESDKIHLSQVLPSFAWQVENQAMPIRFPEENRQLLVSSLARSITHLAQNQEGLVLFIDDLQWVDEATLTLLSKLVRYLPHSRLLILAVSRTAEMQQNQPLIQFLRNLNRHHLIKTLNLSRFSTLEIKTYLQKIAPDLKDDDLLSQTIADRLHHLTGGNLLFITETLRSFLEDSPESLTLDNARILLTDSALERPPDQVAHIILARLERLTEDSRAILDLAAAIKRDFSIDLLETIATKDPLPALELLLQRQFMTEPTPGRLNFSHHLVREVIYNQLSSLSRRRLHQRIANALIALHGKVADSRAVEIAEHSLLAGATAREQALTFFVLAGDYAMRTFGFSQAAQHYQQALDLAKTLSSNKINKNLEDIIRQAYQGLGLALESMAEWDAARDTYKQWQVWAQKNENMTMLLSAQSRLAMMLRLTGQLDESTAIADWVAQQLPTNIPPIIKDAQDRLTLLTSHQTHSPAWTNAGWPAFIAQPVPKINHPWREITKFLGNEEAIPVLNSYGWALTIQGQTETAEAILHYAAQLAEGYKQSGLQATSYHLLAQLWDAKGDYTQMTAALNHSFALVEDTPPLRWAVIWGRIHQAYVDIRWNQLARAKERLKQLNEELAGSDVFRSHHLSVQVGLGLVAMFNKDSASLDEATGYFEKGLANYKNLYASNYVAVYLSQARIKRKYGHLEDAQNDIMHAMSFAGERGMLADYITATVEAARFDRATAQSHHIIPLLEQLEAMASQCTLLPARLSIRLALMNIFNQLEATTEAEWYQRLARTDCQSIAASIPDADDRAAYLARRDLKVL